MSEGESLVNLSVYDKALESKYLQLLNYLLNFPGLTAFDVYEKVKYVRINDKTPWYKTIWRDFEYLNKLNLIEVTQEYAILVKKNKMKDPIPYKLSLNGIFYIILNHVGQSYDELIIPLLQKYGSNVLFVRFLYPLISQETLLKIKDKVVFSIIYKYLKNVCNETLTFVNSSNGLIYTADKDGYLLKRLFMWPRGSVPLSLPESIPFYEEDLRNHLKVTFDWEWIDKARLTPNYEKNSIDIYKPNAPEEIIRLYINEKDDNAILMVNGIKICEFIITLNTLFLSIDAKTDEKKIDFFENIIVDKCKDHESTFLLSMRTQVTPNLQSYELLSNDANLISALDNMDSNIQIKKSGA